jgi:PAS domain S-box-containing protein
LSDPARFRLLQHANRLFGLTSPAQVLAESCLEARSLALADVAYASCITPRTAWERGVHLMVGDAGGDGRPVTPAARSALFAIHRKLAARPAPLLLERTEEEGAIFRGLDGTSNALYAVPLLQRGGRLVGELTLLGARARLEEAGELLPQLAATATAAIAAAQRLVAARRDQDRMSLIAEATDEALWDWSLDADECWWGGSIHTLLGAREDRAMAAEWRFERIHPDDLERVRRSWDGALHSTRSLWREEYRFRRADGTWLHVEDRGYFLREASGRAYRAIGALRDISALKQLLERERAARAEAERASRAKDEFLAMLGHELRNPLAPIVTALQLMRQRGVPEIERELTVVERQSQHLIRLVDDLLDISRIARGKVELKTERIELAALIAKALEMVRPLVERSRHAIELDVPLDGLLVDGEPARLIQVISNLLTNAAKYTDPSGRIHVVARRVEADVELIVRDNGIGIAPEMLPHVFDMFVQERQGIERSQGGLGLGLSIVQNLVRLHGGSVRAHSDGRGRGSELTLRLPAAGPAAPGLERAGAGDPGAAPRRDRGRRVLIVDDNEDAAGLLADLLEAMGHTTRVAHDGPTALRIVESFVPHLAVLDIGLPIMDGYELARRLREQVRGGVRLVALTGYGQDADRRRAAEASFDDHLVKPVTAEHLERLLRELP